MAEMPAWVAVLLGSVFVAFGVGLGYLGREAEPWGRTHLLAKCAMWVAFGLAITVGHWSAAASTVLITVAVAARLWVFLRHRPRVDT